MAKPSHAFSFWRFCIRRNEQRLLYSKDGGTVTLGAERQGDSVRIWLRDSGVGIPKDELDNVFQPFFQVEHTTTRRFSGVGLGLTIAQPRAPDAGRGDARKRAGSRDDGVGAAAGGVKRRPRRARSGAFRLANRDRAA